MIVLGIESSCDETGAAIVAGDGSVLSDVVQSQIAVHAAYGGVVPELASTRTTLRNASRAVVRQALKSAGVTMGDVAAVAWVTHRPGLVGALLVGVQVAKGIAWSAGKPLVGVDHLMGHILSVFLRRDGTETHAVPEFPYVCLLASGGHTALYRVDAADPRQTTELGATRDDAAGEAFDKVGKLLGLGYPGGPAIDRLSRSGDGSRVALPSPMRARDSLEFSFSGLKTQIAHRVRENGVPEGQDLADLCAAFQATVTGTLARKLDAAVAREGVKHAVLGGGVAANAELRRRVMDLADRGGYQVHVPPLASCTDNAAMIAYAGIVRLVIGQEDGLDMVATSATVLSRTTRKGRGIR